MRRASSTRKIYDEDAERFRSAWKLASTHWTLPGWRTKESEVTYRSWLNSNKPPPIVFILKTHCPLMFHMPVKKPKET
jgi:hypothetical protein